MDFSFYLINLLFLFSYSSDAYVFSHPLNKTPKPIDTAAFIFHCFACGIPLLEWNLFLDNSPSQMQKLSLCFLEFLCCRFEVLIAELWTQLIATQNKQSGRSDDK